MQDLDLTNGRISQLGYEPGERLDQGIGRGCGGLPGVGELGAKPVEGLVEGFAPGEQAWLFTDEVFLHAVVAFESIEVRWYWTAAVQSRSRRVWEWRSLRSALPTGKAPRSCSPALLWSDFAWRRWFVPSPLHDGPIVLVCRPVSPRWTQ